jgi:hypothetical protein
MTDDPILTHATEPRGGRLCRCSRCERVLRCTPQSDFFTLDDPGGEPGSPIDNGKPLLCESCFYTLAARRGD